jgi:CheY-like chemotaxis protein
MPEGGRLTIETARMQLDAADAAARPGLEAGAYLMVAVSDTGVGIAPELLDKVYEPFFTTKPVGQGTGLGLSMVYGFAQQSNGQVRIHSQPGQGTSVKIYLPLANTVAAADAPEAPVAAGPAGSGQTILLVEDDASVRLLVTDALQDLGYMVIETSGPREAINVLSSARPIALMVSDVGLPDMNGRQLAEIARQHRRDLPILFITGYAENAAIRSGFLGTGMAMIMKPFTLDALAAGVGEMIEGSAG